jgi:uncharacterized protein involved in exopolysaccharide biosynthesis
LIDPVKLRAGAHALWRRRWIALGIAWALMLLGSTIVILLPNQYESSARVYVDTDSLMGPLLKGIAVQNDLSQQLLVMESTLLSRPNLLKLVHSIYPATDDNNQNEIENISARIRSRTTIEVVGAKLFRIVHVESDPRVAKDVVQSLLGIFVDNGLGSDRADVESTRAFITKQIEYYETQLRAAEARIAEFRSKHPEVSPFGNSYAQRLEAARADVDAATAELAAAKARRDRLPAQGPSTAPASAISPEEAAKDPTLARLGQLRAELNEKLTVYSDQHPDVIALKRQLSALEMKNVDSTIALSQQRLISANETLRRLQETTTSAAKLDAQMADMNRDYAVLKQKYDELRVSGESIRISSDAKTDTESMRFRVVDPPNLPVDPIGPNRPLLLTAVLLASFASGIALVFLLSEIDSSFATPGDLREAFDLPLLGSVCLVTGKADEVRRYYDAMTVSLGAGALVLFCALLIALGGTMRSALGLIHLSSLVGF